jgi:hypothetical protein
MEVSTPDAEGWGEDVGAGPGDLGGDADVGKTNDVATNPDVTRLGDGARPIDVIGATNDDAREVQPDSAGTVSSPDGAGLGEVGQDQDAPVVDAKDASLTIDSGATEVGINPTVDAPIDGSSAFDGVMAGDSDSKGAGDDAMGRDAVEAGEVERDALVVEDTGTVSVDSAVDSGPVIDPDLVLWYPFDESSGTIAYDSAQFGGVARNATLATVGSGGSATFTTARQVGSHALTLSPGGYASNGGGYVVVPAINTLAPGAITIAVWVNLAAATMNQAWERIYDFGDSATAPSWFNLAARNGAAPYGPIFNMSNTGHAEADQQKLTGSTALRANNWHHIAVVLPEGTPFAGIMYVDGVVAASNSAMTVHLADIGATANNWLGRSQFTNDPYFNGSLDDFRVYRRALSQEEIAALMALR